MRSKLPWVKVSQTSYPNGVIADRAKGGNNTFSVAGRWCMNRNWPATNPTHRSITYQERTTMAYRARPALVTIDEGAKLPSLVLGFLPVGGDSRIEGDPSHGSQGTPFGSVSRGAEEPMKPGLRARHPADPFEPPSRQWYRTPDHYPLACVFVPLFPNPLILFCPVEACLNWTELTSS